MKGLKMCVLFAVFSGISISLFAGVGGFMQFYMDNQQKSVEVKRTRVCFSESSKYKLMIDFATPAAPIYAAYMDFELPGGIAARMGQFKTPFSYEKLLSASKLRTIDKSSINSLVGDYDRGIRIGKNYRKTMFYFAIMNGSGRGALNPDGKFDYAARIEMPFSVKLNFNFRTSNSDPLAGIDMQYAKDRILFFAEAVKFLKNSRSEFYIQPEYYIISKHLSFVYRYERGVLPTLDVKNVLGINVFYGKSKFQVNAIFNGAAINYKALAQVDF